MRILTTGVLAAITLVLAACGGDTATVPSGNPDAPGSSAPAAPTLSLAAQVGRKIFFDKTLSGSGKMSCATCHDPASAYGPPNSLAVQLGGLDLQTPATRTVPSLRYKEVIQPYSDQAQNPDGITLPGPGGGFMWDGRVDTLADQAALPMFNPAEMDNASPAAVVVAIQAGAYAALFKQAFGEDVFGNVDFAFAAVGQALQALQTEDPDFHPYSSKFDLYITNKIGGTLTAAEMRGLAIFLDADDPALADHDHANCVACHYAGPNFNGSNALFTDFTYEAIVPPRNMDIPANGDPAYYDMGICGPERTDHLPQNSADNAQYCGLFKAPGLRNVALRTSFFHNGVMNSLNQVVHFYNTRDTNPQIWYPTVGGTPKATPDPGFPTYGLITTQYTGGTVQKFNDLPAQYSANIDVEQPMGGRAAGSKPVMTEQDIQDVICFLGTLTDGYQAPATAPTSGTCVN